MPKKLLSWQVSPTQNETIFPTVCEALISFFGTQWTFPLLCIPFKVHKVTELMMMARRAMSKLNFPRFVSLYPKRILVWGSVSLRVASDKAREIQFGHSPSCHHHQFCHFMNFSTPISQH